MMSLIFAHSLAVVLTSATGTEIAKPAGATTTVAATHVGIVATSGCTDFVPADQDKWHDAGGDWFDCAWHERTSCVQADAFASFGKTASQACCSCGGGIAGGRPSTTDDAPASTSSKSVEQESISQLMLITMVAILVFVGVLTGLACVLLLIHFFRQRGDLQFRQRGDLQCSSGI